jgi:hypothetical protein
VPFFNRSNNKVLPANSRAVDVAKRTIRDIIPVEQRRYQNAFEVQGYETIVYNRLWNGQTCSCQSHRKVSANYLDEDGKLAPGTMDTLLGGGLTFKVQRYGGKEPTVYGQTNSRRFEDGQIMDGDEFNNNDDTFDIVSSNSADIFATTVTDEDMVGDNGPSRVADLDDVTGDFDADINDANDTRCMICMGTGFVGGYSVLNGSRTILHTNSPSITECEGTKEYNRTPHAFWTTRVTFTIHLPKGVVGVDAFRVWNNDLPVYPDMELDGLPYSHHLLLASCDGKYHTLSVIFEDMTYWTHVEMQFNLSRAAALLEFPRLQQGSDLKRQDATDDISINVGPTVPQLKREDLLAECTFGKLMIVQSSTPWNDKGRNVLGFDVSARTIQPEELLNYLPRRVLTNQKATYLVRDNKSGIRRT